jgi:hypothetical protein
MNTERMLHSDRRASVRFPLERRVHYRVLDTHSAEETRDGKTINISGSGVVFTSDGVALPAGRRVELSIGFPRSNKRALIVVARGRVLRSEEGRAALEIEEFAIRRAREYTA